MTRPRRRKILLNRDGVSFSLALASYTLAPEDVRIKLCRRRFWSVVFFLAGRENAGKTLVLQTLYTPVQGNARAKKQEWVGRGEGRSGGGNRELSG